ncbi:MAG TPA: hypothetical protein VNJ29_03620 [Candidatus Nitrosotenuis sp.]|nr:hypothetical protein [Candidatus Nitrosotenuis sp.]
MNKKLRYVLISSVLLGITAYGIKQYIHIMSEALWVKKFRSTDDIQPNLKDVNLEGLSDLRISGSNRPVFADIKKRLKNVKGKIYIVDLTGGDQPYLHGKYPLDFLGYEAKNPNRYDLRLRRLFINGFGEILPQDFVSEEIVARQHGFEYLKFFNTRREPPTSEIIDRIIEIVETLPKDDWLHFHCLGGKGRTTVFMTIVDILKNGKKVSLEDIVKRQYLLGGIDLFDVQVWKTKGSYTVEQLTTRKQFVENFYTYVNDPHGYGTLTWTQWCKAHNIAGMVELK